MLKTPASATKGQALVEMTLTVTLMMFILLATIDFGFAFLYWIAIRDAAQEGAMYGSLHPGVACESAIRDWVRGSANSPVVDISDMSDSQIVITRMGAVPGNPIKVQVVDYYHILTPMISVFVGNPNITISTSVSNTILQTDPSCP